MPARCRPGADYVAAILESVARLSRLIDDVLDLTQGDKGEVALERERVDLAGLCRTVTVQMEPAAKAKQLRFKVVIGEGTGSISGDHRRLRESLEHVLRNAIAYTDKGEVGWSRRGDAEGGDPDRRHGRGLAAEHQARVFERFTRFGERRGEAALGLGLPLTRQFVEAHGGTVQLSSVEGQGDQRPHHPAARAALMWLAGRAGDGARRALRWRACFGRRRGRCRAARRGKTTLVRGVLAALGHEGEVPSPTFAIVQPYDDDSSCRSARRPLPARGSVGARGARARRPAARRRRCWSNGRSGRVRRPGHRRFGSACNRFPMADAP
jgi:hypothetical protein